MPKSLSGRTQANHWPKTKGKTYQHGTAKVTPKTVLKSKKKNATTAAHRPSRTTSLCLYCRADDITKWVQCQVGAVPKM